MEFNMEPERTRETGNTKKKMRVKVLENDLADLRELWAKAKGDAKNHFQE